MRYVAVLQAQRDPAYTLLRIFTGIVLTYHGYQKIFVIGMNGVAGFFGKLGIPLAQIAGPLVSLLEFIGGICLILGIFTRLVGALFAIEFIVATYATWIIMGKGYAGSELEIFILVVNLLIATHGSGRYSVSTRWGRDY